MLGGQVVGIVTNTLGEGDRLGIREPVPSVVNVGGVLMRPLSAIEALTETDLSTEDWKCTAPPTEAILGATVTGELIYDATSSPTRIDPPATNTSVFEITGIKPHPNMNGSIHHVTILCRRMTG